MLDLSKVTLVSIDSAADHLSKNNIRLATISRIVPEILKQIHFGDILMINPFGKNKHLLDIKFQPHWDDFLLEKSPKNIAWLNNFLIKALPKLIKTEWYLIIQWDGFILNPDMWMDEFFRYPFLGGGDTTLNGGFSLRNTETMLEFLKVNKTFDTGAEDGFYSAFLDIPNVRNKKDTPFKIPCPDVTTINNFCKWDSTNCVDRTFGWHRHKFLSKFNIERMFGKYQIFSDSEIMKLVSYCLYKEIDYKFLEENPIKSFDIKYDNQFFDNY